MRRPGNEANGDKHLSEYWFKFFQLVAEGPISAESTTLSNLLIKYLKLIIWWCDGPPVGLVVPQNLFHSCTN